MTPGGTSEPVLRIEDLAVSFAGGRGRRTVAVDGVSLDLRAGRTLAVVGESGSGKSVTALATLRLLPGGGARIDRGRVLLESEEGPLDLVRLPERRMRRVRGGRVAMVFQEPMTSLNPVMSVGEQIAEAVRLHRGLRGRAAREAAAAALDEVGIERAAERISAYPHEFSGGMRQRVMIAMALACGPGVLLADEPTTALDVTVQARVLELIGRLRNEHGLAVMLVSHDLPLVRAHADDVAVLYAGRVLERGPTEAVFGRPVHPYTRALLACIPTLGGAGTGDATPGRLPTVADHMRAIEEIPSVGRPWWPLEKAGCGGIADAAAGVRFVDLGGGHGVACREPAA